MKYSCLLFDLDGTLIDPGEGITRSVAYALRKMGIDPPEKAALYPFIGPPLEESFRELYGMDEAERRRAIAFYREYFQEKGIYENTVYEGIPSLLRVLRARGYMLLVATSKPEPFAERILDRFGLNGYFSYVCGATLEETRTRKAEVVAWALARAGIVPGEALMIGDRRHDVEGARICGVSCMGVLYGYGSREELTQAGAAMLAETVEDIGHLLK
ncbi:MAG: HAD family hydrolase [Clostridiaceae bacterium]|nr:HAD family hydrolase [Clostridiaceae bacterium]